MLDAEDGGRARTLRAVKSRFSTEAGRVEAFSDGVIAVIITVMVLELKPPSGTDLHLLRETLPTFAAYVLSFVFVGIYWNNHHHMLRASDGVDGKPRCRQHPTDAETQAATAAGDHSVFACEGKAPHLQ